MIVYVIQHNEAFLLDDADPVVGALPANQMVGCCRMWDPPAPSRIFLAISQFSQRAFAPGTLPCTGRSGRIYVGLVAVAAPSASRSSI